MKVVTVLSPSHKVFLPNYISGFPCNPNLELHIKFCKQVCSSSEYESEGWHEQMRIKAQTFYDELLKCPEGEGFIFSDPDIQFFGDFYDDMLKEIEGFDVVFQNDIGGGVNTGWFFARNTESGRNLFKAILTFIGNYSNEQKAATDFCYNHKKYLELKDLKWKMLPIEKYWTYGVYRKTWNGKDDFDVPKEMLMHHANWTERFDLKFDILELVKKKYCDLHNILGYKGYVYEGEPVINCPYIPENLKIHE